MNVHRECQNIGTYPAEAGALVLLYHRVADAERDPQLLCVSPKHFREHLEILRRRCRPCALSHCVDHVLEGEVPAGGVAITFDDGYADNLTVAAPLLREQGVPATVFVATRDEGRDREFWWDDLERIILRTRSLPRRLEMAASGVRHEWNLTDGSREAPCAPEWNVQMGDPPTERQALYLHLCRLLRVLGDCERREILDALCAWAGVSRQGRSSHRVMTPDEWRELADDALIEIGAHTVSHPVLSELPVADQFAEIMGSRQRLEQELGRPVRGFAYPYGCRGDFGPATAAMVKNAGLAYACANTGRPPHSGGRVTKDSDPYRLPRVLVRDWDGDTFERHLREAWKLADVQERPRHVGAGA